MTRHVDAFLSVQSPYSYFAAPRLRRLATHPDIQVQFRLVTPGVLRIPNAYAGRGRLEQGYFLLDVTRTAAFLGLDYAEAKPYPVEFEPGSRWRAASEQPRVHRLLSVLSAASEQGRGLTLFEAIMRLVWGGKTKDWHLGNHLQSAAAEVGIDWDDLERLAASEGDRLIDAVHAKDEALLAAGHWGVPCFVVDGEPFYGQDRFDQLIWRLGITAEQIGL